MESAKNNPIIKDHFIATSRASIDEEVYATMKEYGLDEKAQQEAKAEIKTANKVRILALKIKEAQEAKINAKGGDAKVLQEKIESLNQQLEKVNADAAKLKEDKDKEIAKAQSDFFNQLRDYKENEHFHAYKYAGEQDPNVQAKFARLVVEEEMKKLNLKTVFNKESGQVQLLTSTDTIYYKDNKPVDYKMFTDATLAANHLLKVSEPAKGEGNPQQIIYSPSNGQGTKRDTSKMDAALKTSLADVSVTQN